MTVKFKCHSLCDPLRNVQSFEGRRLRQHILQHGSVIQLLETQCMGLVRINKLLIPLIHVIHQNLNLFLVLLIFFTVGKTSLITRFMYDSFDNTYQVCYLFF